MNFETALLHGNFGTDEGTGATLAPIYQSSAFGQDTAEKIEKIFHNKASGFAYSRISNPTVAAFEKRITFLEMLCEKIGIEAECIHGRAEDTARLPEYREKFDFSCARAVAGLSVLSEYCLPFVRQGGTFISLKGRSEDLSEAENSISVLGGKTEAIHDYLLSGDSRRLVLIKKISQIPSKYPRKSGQIKKNPL